MAAVMSAGCRKIMSPLQLVPLLLLLTQVVASSMLQPDKRSKLDTHDGQHGPLDEDAGKARTMTRSRQRTNVDRTVGTPWTNGTIPYEITEQFDSNEVQWIERAMEDWEKVTCVRFRPSTLSDINKVKIHLQSSCTSRIGMEGGLQTLELHKPCFSRGVIHHELGHTIGLIHEHQREQRDSYIKIDYNMVKNIAVMQKYPLGADNKMGVKYDYHSIMHYTRTEQSKDLTRQTIYTRDPTKQFVLGMSLKPTFFDAKVVNLKYQCADRCKNRHWIPCSKECFITAECRCICEGNYPREVCEDRDDCSTRAYDGDCVGDLFYMETYCRKSCHICTVDGSPPGSLCKDTSSYCPTWKSQGECEKNPNFGLRACRLSCGVCEAGSNISVSGPCIDKFSSCPEWAARGDCDTNVPFMVKNCTKSCDFCPVDVGKPPVIAGQACPDYDGMCHVRAKDDGCQKYPQMLFADCRRTCGNCDNSFTVSEGCADNTWECRNWAYLGLCSQNVTANCKLSCKMCKDTQLPEKNCMETTENCPKWALKTRNNCHFTEKVQ